MASLDEFVKDLAKMEEDMPEIMKTLREKFDIILKQETASGHKTSPYRSGEIHSQETEKSYKTIENKAIKLAEETLEVIAKRMEG